MLAKNPAERYQHASEIAQDLTDWENLSSRKAVSSGSAFAERPTGLTPEQSQQLQALDQRRKLMVAAVVALIAILAAMFSLWFFVFSGSPAANDLVGKANNSGPANSGPPANNEPEVPPEVAEANEALKLALGIANLQIGEHPNDLEIYAKEIARLEEALAKYPKADESLRRQVSARLEELKADLVKISQGAAVVRDDWDQ